MAPLDELGEEFEDIDGSDPLLTVDLDEEIETDEPFEYDENAPNLVTAFKEHPTGQKWLKDFAADVCRKFDSAWESSEEYRENFSQMFKIFAGDLPPKEYPYENCANAHVPILVAGVTRLSSRLMAEMFPDRHAIFGVMPTGPDDQDIAEILTLHGNWQIRNELTDFMRQMHRASILFFMPGDVTGYSYFDSIAKVNRHEVLTCDEFVIPFVRVTTMADYSDVPYKFRILDKYAYELEQMKGEWEDVDRVLDREPPAYDDEPEGKLRMAIAEAQGILPPDDDSDAPYRLYHYEGMEELPAQGDDEETVYRPIRAVVDPRTRVVLSVELREEVDWRDQARHDREQAELDRYTGALQQRDAAGMRAQELEAFKASGQMLPGSQEDMELATIQSLLQQPKPMPPSWAQQDEFGEWMPPAPPRKKPIEMFSHGVNIENLMGALGFSQGHQLAEHNKTADTVLSQFIDAATMGNTWSIIAPDTLAIEPGAFEIAPGKVNQIPGVSGNIREQIMELKPAPANDQLIRVVDMMVEYGQTAVAAPEVLSGEPGKSGETFRGIATRIDQAVKQLSTSGGKFSDWVTQILRNNASLNKDHLPDQIVEHVLDHMSGQLRQLKVSRSMYDRDYRVTILADMRFTSMAQRVAEADELLSMPKAVPYLAQSLAFMHAATTKALRARGAHELVALLGPAPPPPTTPFGLPPPPPPGMVPMGPPGAPPPNGARPPGPPGPPQGQPARPAA